MPGAVDQLLTRLGHAKGIEQRKAQGGAFRLDGQQQGVAALGGLALHLVDQGTRQRRRTAGQRRLAGAGGEQQQAGQREDERTGQGHAGWAEFS